MSSNFTDVRSGSRKYIRLQTKLGIAFSAFAIIISVLLTFILYQIARHHYNEELREYLRNIAGIVASQIDGDKHALLINRSQEDSSEYLIIKKELQKLRDNCSGVRYIYTWRFDKTGQLVFIVDAETNPKDVSHLGDIYHREGEAELRQILRNIKGPLTEKDFYTDQWGVWLSGYAPFYKSNGQMEGIVGVDIAAAKVIADQKLFLRRAFDVFIVIIPLAVAAGWFLGIKLTIPIKKLTVASERIAKGDIDYRVNISGNDEIGILASSFNRMTQNLHDEIEVRENEIVSRKCAEEELLFKNAILDTQQQVSLDGILTVDEQGKIVSFNGRFIEIWGILDEIIAAQSDKLALEFVLSKLVDPEEFVSRVKYLYEHKTQKSHEEIALKDGRTLDRYSAPMETKDGRYLGRVWYFRDITERKRAEDALLREHNKAQNYLDVAGVIMLVLNDDFTVHRINNKGCEILGVTENEIFEKNWCDNFIPQEYRNEISGMLRGLLKGEIGTYEYHENPILTKEGKQRLIAWHNAVLRDEDGNIKSILSSGEDITERKESEEAIEKAYKELKKANDDLKNMQYQIIQSEKLASIGQLAAGVAHEMNTPIGFTASNFETLEKYIDKFKTLLDMYVKLADEIPNIDKNQIMTKSAEIKKAADEMKMDFVLGDIGVLFEESKEGISRVTTIIKNLKDFSRIDQVESYDEFDIRKGMEATLNVARNTIKYHADVTVESSDIPQVLCSAGQINQVFLNIIVNAAQAIESQQKETMGSIKIKISSTDTHVVCEIEDDGPGIPQEYIKKIYDPFFTTKPAGKGTGLGLAVSYDIIVNKHKGELLVDSEVGKGTKFTIKLPINRKTPDLGKEIESNGQANHIICGR
jgi:PAS domain S-box-containing protein